MESTMEKTTDYKCTQEDQKMEKKLHRSKTDKLVAGVCGGVAEYLGISSTLVRVLFVFSGIGILAYFIVALIMPQE